VDRGHDLLAKSLIRREIYAQTYKRDTRRGRGSAGERAIYPAVSINLSVNLNKVALLRNSRGATNPSPRVAGIACLDSGAYGLTLHWRHDNRHTRQDDVRVLRQLCRERNAEFNLEGDDREELIALAEELQVTQFTLVPVKPGEITSDHGWDLPRQHEVVAPIVKRLKAKGIRTTIFVDPNPAMMPAAAATGVDRIEIYTEPYVSAWGTPKLTEELERVRATARGAARLGMKVNCGHDLSLLSTPLLAREVPEIDEASIGHALIADSLYLGLHETVRRYVRACHGEAVDAPVTQ
jgi:pyridoxine 5-phosphate synthase